MDIFDKFKLFRNNFAELVDIVTANRMWWDQVYMRWIYGMIRNLLWVFRLYKSYCEKYFSSNWTSTNPSYRNAINDFSTYQKLCIIKNVKIHNHLYRNNSIPLFQQLLLTRQYSVFVESAFLLIEQGSMKITSVVGTYCILQIIFY